MSKAPLTMAILKAKGARAAAQLLIKPFIIFENGSKGSVEDLKKLGRGGIIRLVITGAKQDTMILANFGSIYGCEHCDPDKECSFVFSVLDIEGPCDRWLQNVRLIIGQEFRHLSEFTVIQILAAPQTLTASTITRLCCEKNNLAVKLTRIKTRLNKKVTDLLA